jgi:uncharacterized membrane protein
VSFGWRSFTANLGPLLGIAGAVVLANLGISALNWVLGDGLITSAFFSIATSLVSMMISLGLIRAALAIVDGWKPEIAELSSTDGIGVYLVASVIVSVVVGIGLVACVLPGLVAAFLFQFYGYAVVDRRADAYSVAANADPIAALRTSFQVVTKNLGSVLVLALVSFAINLVGALLCGIGLLVSLPVTAIALAYAWRAFTGGDISQRFAA